MWKKPMRTKEWPRSRPANGLSRESAPDQCSGSYGAVPAFRACVCVLYFMYIFIWNKAISFQLTVPTWATSSRRPRHMPAYTYAPKLVCVCIYLNFYYFELITDIATGPAIRTALEPEPELWPEPKAAIPIAIKQISPRGEYYTAERHHRHLSQKQNWGKLQTQTAQMEKGEAARER